MNQMLEADHNTLDSNCFLTNSIMSLQSTSDIGDPKLDTRYGELMSFFENPRGRNSALESEISKVHISVSL